MRPLRRDINRDATIVALYKGGATMDEIGEISGNISRQRVQQILQRNGVKRLFNGKRIDPLQIIAACRKPGIRNWHQVSEEVGTKNGGLAVRTIALRLGMEPAINRLFRLRRAAHRRVHAEAWRARLALQYRDLCVRLGRVASFRELRPANGVPFWTTFLMFFPSIKEVRIAAGVDPKDQRGNGRRGHRKTHCKRKHVLAETRNKWGQCRECDRIRHSKGAA